MLRFVRLGKYCALILAASAMAVGCTNTQEKARAQLKELGYEFTGDDLSRALDEKDHRAVSLYAQAKIDPNVVVSKTGCPILSLAILRHERTLTDYMLDAGANLKVTCLGGLTLPMAAGIEADAPMLERLGKNGADFKALMDDGTGVFGIIVNAKDKSEVEKLEALKVAVKYGARPIFGKKSLAALGNPNLAGSDLENISRVGFYAVAKQAGEEKLAAYINSLPKAQNTSESVADAKDCTSSSKIPDGSDAAVLKVCQASCEADKPYACGVAGRTLAGFGGRPAIDKEKAFQDFQKGCDLKDYLTCAEIVRNLPERMKAYESECKSNGNARACAFVAIQYGESHPQSGRAPASDTQFVLGSKSCDNGDALGCIAAGMDYIQYINPDDSATVQKWGGAARPFFKKACDQGWQQGCEMMK